MSYDNEMARAIKSRTEKPPDAAYARGTVVSLSPLTISLYGGEVMATGNCLLVSETVKRLLDPLPACAFNNCHHGQHCENNCFPPRLAVGDTVVCIGRSVFFAVDRYKGGA